MDIVITISVLIFLMILFMFWILKRTVNRINMQAKSYFVNKLQNYDELIEAKEEKLKAIEEQLSSKEPIPSKNRTDSSETEAEPSATALIDGLELPSYRDEYLLQRYKKMEEAFQISSKDIIREFLKQHPKDPKNKRYARSQEINRKLDFSLRYSLLTLSKEKQWKELKKHLTKEEWALVEEYRKEQGEFELLGFLSYLKEQLINNNPTIYVYVGSKEENYDAMDDRIQTQYSESIYRGIKIIYQNRLYDYSLS